MSYKMFKFHLINNICMSSASSDESQTVTKFDWDREKWDRENVAALGPTFLGPTFVMIVNYYFKKKKYS